MPKVGTLLLCLVLLSTIAACKSNKSLLAKHCRLMGGVKIYGKSAKSASFSSSAVTTCIDALDASERGFREMFRLHQEATEVYVSSAGRGIDPFKIIDNVALVLGRLYKQESIKLMSHYIETYQATSVGRYATVVENLALKNGYIVSFDEHDAALPSDWVSQYGELIATMATWYSSKEYVGYRLTELSAERLSRSQFEEISGPARIIMNNSIEKQYRQKSASDWEIAATMFIDLAALGSFMPDSSPSEFTPPEEKRMDVIQQLHYYGKIVQ